MATWKNIHMGFWTDAKLVDDFSAEDKYFYLYLLTNPQTRLCGCYKISFTTMSNQLGYSKETILLLLERFENFHKVIRFSEETKEVLLLNWYKYNWQGGNQFSCIEKEIETVKSPEFREILNDLLAQTRGLDTPYKPLISPLQGGPLSLSINSLEKPKDLKTFSNTDNNINNKAKHKYGEYKHVQLTDDQYKKLLEDLGQTRLDLSIKVLDEYCEVSGKSYKNYNLVLRGWVQDKVNSLMPKTEDEKPKRTKEQLEELRRSFTYGGQQH